jgi:WD40-like Beta Propeller Repeat
VQRCAPKVRFAVDLYGVFPVKRLFFGFCSQFFVRSGKGRSSSRRLRSGSRSARKGSRDRNASAFGSSRPGGLGGFDLYVSRRSNKHDDFGWQEPVNLGSVNSPEDDTAATYFEDEETGIIVLYVTSTRPGGPVGSKPRTFHIYVSTLGDDGSFGPAVLVPELNSQDNDTRTAIRRDGLEFFLSSDRPNGRIGVNDILVSTRDSTLDPWSTAVNLGPTVNYPSYVTGAPALSWDGTTLYFYSDRRGGFGGRDLHVATRERSVDPWGKSGA